MSTIGVLYVTSSEFKMEENRRFRDLCRLRDGSAVGDIFEFEIVSTAIKEVLEVDIALMVTAEAKAAYAKLKVPCIVEHAGLIFDDYAAQSYPGGLTKPMWNALADAFVHETHSADRLATARAVVAYCDGKTVRTFVGETKGKLSPEPRGSREFYWDTVFIPLDHNPDGLTYAEIVDTTRYGLDYKIEHLSQSTKAMIEFLEWRRLNDPELWDVVY